MLSLIGCIILIQLTTVTYCFKCPCANQSLCEPVKIRREWEVFAFSVSHDNWPNYDYSKVTTIAIAGYINDSLTCYAHSKNVRVSLLANIPKKELMVPSARKEWIKTTVSTMKEHFLDGINVDFEDPILSNETDIRKALTSVVSELTLAAKQVSQYAQITFDVAWSSNCIDSRCYDYVGLASVVDFLFVMAYDEQSQTSKPCTAWANSAFNKTAAGVKTFLKSGIMPSQLVLGVPWYGYQYPCLKLTQDTCEIAAVPFRGSECSDAVGRQVDYYTIMTTYLPASTSGRKWDDVAKSPYFNYQNTSSGVIYQFWYDDPASLLIKYSLAQSLKLRGVGMWEADDLNYGPNEEAKKQRTKMWGTIPSHV